MKTIHIIVKGKVQGVFFRATAREVAERYHLKGWVRNMDSGDVEIKVRGDEKDLNAFIDWCRKGPADAEVEQVIISESAPVEEKDFRIIRY